MTKERLAEIEARAAKATPGPWEAAEDPDWRVIEGCSQSWHMALAHADVQIEGDGEIGAAHDADFIANARTDIPDLISYVRKLEAENERLRRGSAEAYQMAGNSDYPVGYMDNFLALADGEKPPHEWKVLREEDHAVRAKTEAARDGGEG